MKRTLQTLCLALCFSASSSAFAVMTIPYFGVGAGSGIIATTNGYAFSEASVISTTHKHNGLMGRVFAGFNANNYLGIEASAAKFTRARYTATTSTDSASLSYYADIIELVLKAYLPIGRSGLDLYGSAGAAQIREAVHYLNPANIPLSGIIAQPTDSTTTIIRRRPLFGAGIQYTFSKYFSAGIEYRQSQKLGNFTQNALAIPRLRSYTVNFIYNLS